MSAIHTRMTQKSSTLWTKKVQLEKDIGNAFVWSKENCLNFKFDKFKKVQFSKRKNQNKQILHPPSNGTISQKRHFKDLAI